MRRRLRIHTSALGFIDDIIEPSETRKRLILALKTNMDKTEESHVEGTAISFEVHVMSKESRKLVACIVAALLEEQQSEDVADIHRSKGNRWGCTRQRASSGVNRG